MRFMMDEFVVDYHNANQLDAKQFEPAVIADGFDKHIASFQ